MDISYELFRNSKDVDLRPHKDTITECFQMYFPDYKIVVREHEIIIKNCPDSVLPRILVRRVSEELLTHEEMRQYVHVQEIKRLLAKKRSIKQ